MVGYFNYTLLIVRNILQFGQHKRNPGCQTDKGAAAAEVCWLVQSSLTQNIPGLSGKTVLSGRSVQAK